MSFGIIFLVLLINIRDMKIKARMWSIIGVLSFYYFYATFLGSFRNGLSVGLVAEGIFWIEIVLYFVILQGVHSDTIHWLVRSILRYSFLNGILSVIYFWYLRDQIAVAALVDGVRVVRIADLLAPLLIHLFIFHKHFNNDKDFKSFWIMPAALLVILGMFRSVWAAFILSYLLANLLAPRLKAFYEFALILIIGVIGLTIFDLVFEYFFGVKGVILGRIFAGVGSADSLGRVTSALVVFNQFSEDVYAIIFGAGFGKMAWFVNDFGQGEVFALQPVGSLSNYYIVFLFQVGLVLFMLYFMYGLYCLVWIHYRFSVKSARIIYFALFYFLLQWLTFPTSNHYPIAFIIALYFVMALQKCIVPTHNFKY